MSDAWYTTVDPKTRLTQGDLIFDCPLVGWATSGEPLVTGADETEFLKSGTEAFRADVVVMTQACDLEHDKVNNVVVCPHLELADYRGDWEEAVRARKQNPTEKAWKSHYSDIRDGLVWNLSLLNCVTEGAIRTGHRVVDFHEVFTLPRVFLESLSVGRNKPRLRLLPPYREHLSQAFARFFMRVGLPVPVSTPE
jgi:hypothetical protein